MLSKICFLTHFLYCFQYEYDLKSQRIIALCVVLLLFYALRQENGLNVAGIGSCNKMFFPQFEGAFKK